MVKSTMNEDIQKYPIYGLNNGRLFRIYNIHSTRDYNHYMYSMHHYILRKHYEDNIQWYKDRGIEQKLILLPIYIHEQVHNIAIKNLSDEDFEKYFKINRNKLFYKRNCNFSL